MASSDNNVYIPGVCNIGKAEIIRRRNGAIGAFLVAVILAIVLVLLHADKLWRLVIFIPLTSACIGFQQWFFKFCVGFGMKGLFNFKDLGENMPVEEAELRKKDRNKAIQMIVTGIIAALIVTLGFYLIP